MLTFYICFGGAILFVLGYIWLSPKTLSEQVLKENPAFKSSLRHNGDAVSPEEVFKVLKENGLESCFLKADLDNDKISSTISKNQIQNFDVSSVTDNEALVFYDEDISLCEDGILVQEQIKRPLVRKKIPTKHSNSK